MSAAKVKILVVEDMFTSRKLVIHSCKEIGYSEISEAADGEAAWALLQSGGVKYDLIICDLNMPNLNGIELLKRVRNHAIYSKIPFVMLTAESEHSLVIEAIKSGVSTYCIKPFSTATLKDKISEAFKKAPAAA